MENKFSPKAQAFFQRVQQEKAELTATVSVDAGKQQQVGAGIEFFDVFALMFFVLIVAAFVFKSKNPKAGAKKYDVFRDSPGFSDLPDNKWFIYDES